MPYPREAKGLDRPVPGATCKTLEELREDCDELSRRVNDMTERYYGIPTPMGEEHELMTPPRVEATRLELLMAARSRGTVTYGQLMRITELSRGKPLFDVIVAVDREEHARGAPGFAAIIVRKDTGFPGGGFFCDERLPKSLRRPYARASDPKLSAAEMNYVKEAQKRIWDYYSSEAQIHPLP